MILFFILCYKISPIIFTINIFFSRHVKTVTNLTSHYKISPIIFTITIICCWYVTNVSNVTSRYKISPYYAVELPLSVHLLELVPTMTCIFIHTKWEESVGLGAYIGGWKNIKSICWCIEFLVCEVSCTLSLMYNMAIYMKTQIRSWDKLFL